MRFQNFRHPLVALVGILVLLLVVPLSSNAEEDASTLSGRVIDMEENPVSDLTLGIQPIDIIDGEMWQIPTPMQQSRTNSTGSFHIGGIVPGHAKLVMVPKTGNFESDTEIRSIDIGGLSFLPIDMPNFQISHEQRIRFLSTFEVEPKKVSTVGGIPLYIKSGVDIKDITVTVRPRMRIRCRVLLVDDTPLTDATVKLHLNYRSLDDVMSGNFSRSPTYTDSDGYIVLYVNLPAFCTVSVEYQGDTATAETFKIAEGQRRHDLVFRLSEASVPPVPKMPMPNPMEAWVVNPVNGHAYKKIRCRSWKDAHATATAEGAHLVSINDEAEQKWLVETFGEEPFLIGLTYVANQTEWRWTSGEPVTYTNWALQELEMDQDVLVFVDMINGKWHIGTSESLQRIGIALLEKEDGKLETK